MKFLLGNKDFLLSLFRKDSIKKCHLFNPLVMLAFLNPENKFGLPTWLARVSNLLATL